LDEDFRRTRLLPLAEAYAARGEFGAALRTTIPIIVGINALDAKLTELQTPSSRAEKIEKLGLILQANRGETALEPLLKRITARHAAPSPLGCAEHRNPAPTTGAVVVPKDALEAVESGRWIAATMLAFRDTGWSHAVEPALCMARALVRGARPTARELPWILLELGKGAAATGDQELTGRLLEAARHHSDGSPELAVRIDLEKARLRPFDHDALRRLEMALGAAKRELPAPLEGALLNALGTARLVVGGDVHGALAQAISMIGEDAEQWPAAVATLRALSLSDQRQGHLQEALASADRVLVATQSPYWGKPILLSLEWQRRNTLAREVGRPAVPASAPAADPLGFDGVFRSVDDMQLSVSTDKGMGPVALEHGMRRLSGSGRPDLAAAAGEHVIAAAIALNESPFTIAFYRSVLGRRLFEDGDFASAEAQLTAAVDYMSSADTKSVDGGGLAVTCSYLVTARKLQDRLAEAEAAADRCKRMLDQSKDAEGSWAARFLLSVADVLVAQGRDDEAKPLVDRALQLAQAGRQGGWQATLAEAGIAKAELMRRRTGTSAPDTADDLYAALLPLGDVAERYPPEILLRVGLDVSDLGYPGEAEIFLRAAFSRLLETVAPDHAEAVSTLVAWGHSARLQGDQKLAQDLLSRSIRSTVRTFGQTKPLVAGAVAELGRIALQAGDKASALDLLRHAVRLREDEWLLERQSAGLEGRSPRVIRESSEFREELLNLSEALREQQEASPEAFRMLQAAERSDTATMLLRAAIEASTTGSAGPPNLNPIRAVTDAEERWRQADVELRRELITPAVFRSFARGAALREALDEAGQQLRRAREQAIPVLAKASRYSDLRPTDADAVQEVLRADEAVAAYQVGASYSHVWIVRRGSIRQFRLDVGAQELANMVASLRRGIVDTEPGGRVRPGNFENAAAAAAFHVVLGPAWAELTGVHHLVVVPDGPLSSLPFAVLQIQRPKSGEVPRWLGAEMALTVLPAVGLLPQVLAGPEPAPPLHLLGVGDPLVPKHPMLDKLVKRAFPPFPAYQAIPPLQDAESELDSLASLRTDSQRLVMADATKAKLQSTDLDRYDLIVFATHALTAQESASAFGISQPGLVLTPPPDPGPFTDALLTPSSIAQLRLNNPLVILSACNTAESDGAPGAETLSGLARGFFAAGASNLLVSYWSIPSEAASLLVPAFVRELGLAPRAGRARALLRSMTAVRNDDSYARFAHPFYWAGFALVGNGSAQSEEPVK
jgi:CHAT domain-containing protein